MAPADASPPLVVSGTGALACAIGGLLARAGERVCLVGTWTAARDAIARRGVVVHEGIASWSAPVEAASVEDVPRGSSLAIVAVKSHRTAEAAPTLARALAPEGVAVSLQNGLGHRSVLEAALGRGRVAVGTTTLGARLLGPGEVQIVPGRVVLGEEPATAGPVAGLAARMRAAGLDVELTRDVDRLVFSKLAVNCAINPLSALRGVPNGALVGDEETRLLLRTAALEVAALARARGIRLEGDAGALAEAVARATASNRSSMLQDLERGAETEIDALCGAVVAEGQKLGVPVPVNEALWRRVREREGRPVREGELSAATPGPDRPGAPGAPA